jgi:hypothetical protein
MPDFEDPFTKADSSIIYIDDIRVSADSMLVRFIPRGRLPESEPAIKQHNNDFEWGPV